MLGAARGRAKFLARLGPEANDALDEFLNLALDYETRETPSLQGFLAWLRAAQSEVKRDMEMVRDEVRVMTVHGAKGLEANTVILADTTTPPGRPARSAPARRWPERRAGLGDRAQGEDVGAMMDARAQAQQDARDEYRRLLYVAMTRAKERLVICGTQGAQQDSRRLLVSAGRGRAEARLRRRSRPTTAAARCWRYRKGAAARAGATADRTLAGRDQADVCCRPG